MRTKQSLIDEINKFPDDAKFFAYEGEPGIGIVVNYPDDGINRRKQGFIYCQDDDDQKETKLVLN
jgi:hypothetical protein